MKKANKIKVKRGNGPAFPFNWNTVNHALNTIEQQAERAYTQFKHALPRKWEKRLDQLGAKEIMQMALKTRKQITKDVRYYAEGLIDTLSRAPFLPERNRLVREARRNLENVLKKIQKTQIAVKAKHMASSQGSVLLSYLNFPTKRDVARLNTRLSEIEKRLKSLRAGRRAPQPPPPQPTMMS